MLTPPEKRKSKHPFTTIALSREMRDWLNSLRQYREPTGTQLEPVDNVIRRLKVFLEENSPSVSGS